MRVHAGDGNCLLKYQIRYVGPWNIDTNIDKVRARWETEIDDKCPESGFYVKTMTMVASLDIHARIIVIPNMTTLSMESEPRTLKRRKGKGGEINEEIT